MEDSEFNVPDAMRQSNIHQLLLTARKVWLADALGDALEEVDPLLLKTQAVTYVSKDAQRILAVARIRDEAVFPLPAIIESRPTLVAYYRLLLGVSQKQFYVANTGMTPFRRLETGSPLTPALRQRLPSYCAAMCHALDELVLQTGSTLEPRDVEDLQLLTLGSFYYGSQNNAIGQIATLGVFNALAKVVEPLITNRTKNTIELMSPTGRHVRIRLASDPDVRIVELINTVEQPLVSIEIKGGTDKSNAYNRGGEAEKSHQGAKSRGFKSCWTIINMANIDINKLKQGSPTTSHWFDANEVVGQKGDDWLKFQLEVASIIA